MYLPHFYKDTKSCDTFTSAVLLVIVSNMMKMLMWQDTGSPGNHSVPTGDDSSAPADDATQQQPSTASQAREEVEQLRHLVASLRVAADFAKAISGALGTLGSLLGSATLSDVQEALALVISCRQFQVTGIEGLLRRMLLLVFAREQGMGRPLS